MLSSLAAFWPRQADTCLSLLFIQSSFHIQWQQERSTQREREGVARYRECASVCMLSGLGWSICWPIDCWHLLTWPPGRASLAKTEEEKERIWRIVVQGGKGKGIVTVVGAHFACNSLDCRQNTFAYFSASLSLPLSLPFPCRLWPMIIRQHLPMSRETWATREHRRKPQWAAAFEGFGFDKPRCERDKNGNNF